jgi:hypothetical protein
VQLWDFDSTDDTVTAVQNLVSATVGAFAFSSATAVAAWAQAQAAVEWTVDFIPQASWSEDIDFTIVPSKLTPYEISFEYLGAGAIEFKAENPSTGAFETVHMISPAGDDDLPTLLNPTFRLGVASENKGNATAIRVESASFGGFIEGKKINTAGSKGASNTAAGVGLLPTNIITLRNRNEFGDIRNLAEVIIAIVGASTDSTKPVDVQIIKNASPILGSSFVFSDFNNTDSIMQIAIDQVTVTGGEVIAAGSPGELDFGDLNQILIPGESITVAMNITSGAASVMKASAIWLEDQ